MNEKEEMEGVADKQVTIPEALIDHEGRIVRLEAEQNKLFEKLDDINNKMDKQNEEQKNLLNKLIEHHLSTKKLNITSFWKWVISITGAGGLLTIVGMAIVNFFK